MSEENALPGQEVTLTAIPTVDDVIEAMKDVIDPELMVNVCLLYTSPSPRDQRGSRMPSSA